jgi:hypothetical protein
MLTLRTLCSSIKKELKKEKQNLLKLRSEEEAKIDDLLSNLKKLNSGSKTADQEQAKQRAEYENELVRLRGETFEHNVISFAKKEGLLTKNQQ